MLFNYKEHRIFAFSDSHGMHKRLHIPEEADILLCAGDVVSGFGKDGMENFFSWLLSHPAKLYIFVAGNHELFLEDSLEQTISLLPKKVVFLHDSTFEFDGISFGNISMRSLQSKEQNVQSATKMDFLITHIPRQSLSIVLEVTDKVSDIYTAITPPPFSSIIGNGKLARSNSSAIFLKPRPHDSTKPAL